MTSQEKEIQTIKPRTIQLNLSDADVERISMKSVGVGLTVAELLQNFIGDLVCGTYTNGSDERMYANQYFERCGFSMFPSKTFLRYLLDYDDVDRVLYLLEDILSYKKDLSDNEENFSDFDEEDLKIIKDELAEAENELNEVFSEYVTWAVEEARTLEDEIAAIIEWKINMDNFKGNASCDYCNSCSNCKNSGYEKCYSDCDDETKKHFEPKSNYCPQCGKKLVK